MTCLGSDRRVFCGSRTPAVLEIPVRSVRKEESDGRRLAWDEVEDLTFNPLLCHDSGTRLCSTSSCSLIGTIRVWYCASTEYSHCIIGAGGSSGATAESGARVHWLLIIFWFSDRLIYTHFQFLTVIESTASSQVLRARLWRENTFECSLDIC